MTCPRTFDHANHPARGHEVLACSLKAGHKRPCLMEWRPATESEVRAITRPVPRGKTIQWSPKKVRR